MDAQLSDLVLMICERGGQGSIDRVALRGYISPTGDYRPPFAEELDERGRRWVTLDVAGLRLCDDHCTDDGCEGGCDALHLCKYFLLGRCTRRAEQCDYGHNIQSSHNYSVLQSYGLHNASLEALQAIIKSHRTKQTLPSACSFYNNEKGCRKPTEGRSACSFLHVCRYFLESDCKFGSGCKRSHDLSSSHTRTILDQYGLKGFSSSNLLRQFRTNQAKSTGNRMRSSSSSSNDRTSADRRLEDGRERRRTVSLQQASHPVAGVSAVTTKAKALKKPLSEIDSNRPPQICMYNLIGKCFYGAKCRNHHSTLPYQWQLKKQDAWWDCPTELNNSLEENYCKLNVTSASLLGPSALSRQLKMDYKQMTLNSGLEVSEVRRLETISKAVSDTWLFATEWRWYFEDSNGIWTEYGQRGFSGTTATVNSTEIEKCYQNYLLGKHDSKLQLQTEKFTYVINFQKFRQKNLKTKVKRDVFRRPSLFVTQSMLEDIKRRKQLSNSGVAFPIEWTSTSIGSNECFQLSEVVKQSPEYNKVAVIFKNTFPSAVARKIERIQNPSLWEEYYRMKEKMKIKRQDKLVDERLLFHGTGDDNLSAICQQGFDPRVAGLSSGTAYGCGAYFSSSAEYSHKYAKTSGKMIVASVLVGDFVKGNREYRRPPPRNPLQPFGDLYDCVVNDIQSPTIFVIFDARQVYPNYVVNYDYA